MMNNINFFIKSCYYNFLAQLQYKVNSIISLLSVSIDMLGNILIFYFIFYRFSDIGGWNFYQVVFMYSIFLTGHGLVLTFSRNLWGFSRYLITGTLDQLCVRPRNLLLQLLCSSFSISALIYFIGGAFLIVHSAIQIDVSMSFRFISIMTIVIISSCFIELSITVILVAICFWVIDISALIYLNVEVVNDFLGYPLNIYNKIIRIIFTFVYPIAFMNYYPSLYFLQPNLNSFMKLILTPFVAGILFLCAYNLFFRGIEKYQSVGS